MYLLPGARCLSPTLAILQVNLDGVKAIIVPKMIITWKHSYKSHLNPKKKGLQKLEF